MRILLVTPSTPFDQSFGGGQRSAHMHAALLMHGTVDVLVLNESERFGVLPGEHPGELARVTYGSGSALAKYRADPAVAAWIAATLDIAAYDLIVGRYLTALCIAGIRSDAPQLVDVDDANYRYAPADDSLRSKFFSNVKTMVRKAITRRAIQRFDYVWFASALDRQAFPVARSGLLPNIPRNVNPLLPPTPGSAIILFVGAMWYQPNRDAADWFLEKCWAAIRQVNPMATFRIVGACPASEQARWNGTAGVEATGFVDDLAAHYREAAFTISPIHFGGGTQIKVLESLGYGRAVIVSSLVYRPYEDVLVIDESVLVADTARAMIGACTTLLNDSAQAERIGQAGHAAIAAAFSPEVFQRSVAKAIAEAQRMSERNT